MGKGKQQGLIAILAEGIIKKKCDKKPDKYSALGKELLAALKKDDSAELGKLFKSQVDIAVSDALRQKDGED